RIHPNGSDLSSVGTRIAANEFPTIDVKIAGRDALRVEWQRATGQYYDDFLAGYFANSRVYALNPDSIAKSVQLQRTFEIDSDGAGLAAVLTNLQDQFPERFEALNDELHCWMPEFDRVLFDTPAAGHRAFMLRTTEGSHP